MLSLVLAIEIIILVVRRKRSGKKVFPAEFFKDQLSRTPPYDDPPFKLLAWFILISFIFALYAGMFAFMKDYNATFAEINQYRNTISQLESKITDVDKSIESIFEDSKLREEENLASIEDLEHQKQILESELKANISALQSLPLGTPERLKLYKFLIYFG